MTIAECGGKIKRRIWGVCVRLARNKAYYPKLYRAYWHALLHTPKKIAAEVNYYSAVPNQGAGIGHQLANWIAGYWFARQYGLKFSHTPFPQEKWENFLGFGEDEVTVEELIKKRGYKKILLPLFDEFMPNEIDLIKRVIDSYRDQRVVFVAEQDQFYKAQHGVMRDLKRKFYRAKARKEDRLLYSKEHFNVAIHVRRGDIVIGRKSKASNLVMRWQDEKYFAKVLAGVTKAMAIDKPIRIYLFSQGGEKEFPAFKEVENLIFCLDMDAQKSFSHMIYADLLITSKSSFSYSAALLNNGIKICPRNFWHAYPAEEDWIMAEEDGTFDLLSKAQGTLLEKKVANRFQKRFFTIVIPLYNKAHTIIRTLGSVLAQTFSEFEVVIINDGSTDNGVEVIRNFTDDPRVRIIEQENQGVSAARNMGVACAQCEYIAFLDGDDEWLPDYLAKMKEAIEKFPEAGMYCCAGMIRNKKETWFRLANKYKRQIVRVNYFENPHVFSHTSATIISKAAFLKTKGFPLGMKNNQDFALFYAVAFIAPVIYCGFMLSVYVGDVSGQATSATGEERNNLLEHITDRINLSYENWKRCTPRNELYLVFDKYDTRARVLSFLKRRDYASVRRFVHLLSVQVKRNYSDSELWLYQQKSFRLFAMVYIYFTKLIWRSYGFPVVGHDKLCHCVKGSDSSF